MMRKVFLTVSLFALALLVCADDALARGGRRGRRGGGCGGGCDDGCGAVYGGYGYGGCGGYAGGCGHGGYAGGCGYGGGVYAGGFHGGYYAHGGDLHMMPGAAYAGIGDFQTQQSFYSGPGVQPQGLQPQTGMFTILVDQPDAEILIDGTATRQRGLQRVFQVPPQAGDNVSYTIKARWNEGGKMVERERRLQLTQGQMNMVDFRANAAPANRTPNNTVPNNTAPSNTVPGNTVPNNTTPEPLPR